MVVDVRMEDVEKERGKAVGEGDIFWKSGRGGAREGGGVVLGGDEHGRPARGTSERKPMCWFGGVETPGYLSSRAAWGTSVWHSSTGYLGRDGPTGTALELPTAHGTVRWLRGSGVVHYTMYYSLASGGGYAGARRKGT